MSTHSNISIKTDKGYETIYCHNDGYPSYMYPMLRDYYGSLERATALVSFGDASSIAKRIMPSQGSKMPCSVGLLAHVCVSRRAPHRSSFTPGSKAGDFHALRRRRSFKWQNFFSVIAGNRSSCDKETAHLQKRWAVCIDVVFRHYASSVQTTTGAFSYRFLKILLRNKYTV